MAQLLIVHHTPSPPVHAMLDAVVAGANDPQISDVEVVLRPALVANPIDVLEADGYVLGTPANLGYISGALKHFFDTIYYPCLDATAGRPFGAFIHGGEDTTGAQRAIETITTGLRWKVAQDIVTVVGKPDRATLDACRELGAVLAATVMP